MEQEDLRTTVLVSQKQTLLMRYYYQRYYAAEGLLTLGAEGHRLFYHLAMKGCNAEFLPLKKTMELHIILMTHKDNFYFYH